MKNEKFKCIETLHTINDISEAIKHEIGLNSMYTGWLSHMPGISHACLAEVEKRIGIAIPSDLSDFLHSYGCFYSHMDGDGTVLGFFNRPSFPEICGGMANVLDACWCFNECLDSEAFPQQAIEYLNANYIVFGHFMENEDTFHHFYFDKSGNFGVLKYDQNFTDDAAWQHLLELRDGHNHINMSFYELLNQYLKKTLEMTQNAYQFYTHDQ
jgi:hypothetical protein